MPLLSNFINSLEQYLSKLSINGEIELVLALSGGLDSVVLLDLLANIKNQNYQSLCKSTVIPAEEPGSFRLDPGSARIALDRDDSSVNKIDNLKIKYNISAVYIDHQLQADSFKWREFNQKLAQKYIFRAKHKYEKTSISLIFNFPYQ